MNDALLAGLAMGLLGGIASAAYVALTFRSCPLGSSGDHVDAGGITG